MSIKPTPHTEWFKAARRAGSMLARQDGRNAAVGYIRRVLDTSPYGAALTLGCMLVDPKRSSMERACAVRLLTHATRRSDIAYLLGVL